MLILFPALGKTPGFRCKVNKSLLTSKLWIGTIIQQAVAELTHSVRNVNQRHGTTFPDGTVHRKDCL
jgi:hypothetical protein